MALTLNDLTALDGTTQLLQNYRILRGGDALPDNLLLTPAEDETLLTRDMDTEFALGFYKDRSWLFRFFKTYQPKTYDALMSASDLHLLVLERPDWSPGVWKPAGYFLESAGRLFRLELNGRIPLEEEIDSPLFGSTNTTPSLLDRRIEYYGEAMAHSWWGNINALRPATRFPYESLGATSNQLYTYLLLNKHGPKAVSKTGTSAAKLLKKDFQEIEKLFPFFKEERALWNKKNDSGLSRSLRFFSRTGLEKVIMQCPFDVKGLQDTNSTLKNENGVPYLFYLTGSECDEWYRIDDPVGTIDSATAHMLTKPDEPFDMLAFCTRFN